MKNKSQQIYQLIKKDIILDWRMKHPFLGIILFVITTVFTVYLSVWGIMNVATWSTLFWIILLFVANISLSKTFLQEKRRHLYYGFTVSPDIFIISKLIYSVIFMLFVGILGFVIYILLLGLPQFSMVLFGINLLNGIIGFSLTFTMVSALAFRTQEVGNMMVILGFPVVLPVLLLSIKNSKKIVEGAVWSDINENTTILFLIHIIIATLTLILFPYSWKS